MAEAGLDAMVVTALVNVRYLTGFTGSNAALLVFADDRGPLLATDSRYRTQAQQQVPGLEVLIERAGVGALVSRAAQAGAHKLGFESHVMTVDGLAALTEVLSGAAANAELVRAPGLVEALREVKDADEVASLRLACAAADAALAELVGRGGLRPGRTERAVARELEALMLDHGADAVGFETIVAAGANSAIPHHRPTDNVLTPGDFVKIDFGAQVAGYHSDTTRTFVLGPAADWQREIYQVVAAAQQVGCQKLAPGANIRDIDAAARQVVTDADYEQFGHGLGHGVGLAVHEAPTIGATSAGTLLAGSVVTVEPGIYLPGRGGVRIEDTLVVAKATPDGQTSELLTRFPKELTIL